MKTILPEISKSFNFIKRTQVFSIKYSTDSIVILQTQFWQAEYQAMHNQYPTMYIGDENYITPLWWHAPPGTRHRSEASRSDSTARQKQEMT